MSGRIIVKISQIFGTCCDPFATYNATTTISNETFSPLPARERAKEKSKAINYHIAYPEEILNNTALDILYDGLHIDDSHYFENNINMSVFGTNYAFKKLREPIDKNDWRTHGSAAVVNAYYSPIENSISESGGRSVCCFLLLQCASFLVNYFHFFFRTGQGMLPLFAFSLFFMFIHLAITPFIIHSLFIL